MKCPFAVGVLVLVEGINSDRITSYSRRGMIIDHIPAYTKFDDNHKMRLYGYGGIDLARPYHMDRFVVHIPTEKYSTYFIFRYDPDSWAVSGKYIYLQGGVKVYPKPELIFEVLDERESGREMLLYSDETSRMDLCREPEIRSDLYLSDPDLFTIDFDKLKP